MVPIIVPQNSTEQPLGMANDKLVRVVIVPLSLMAGTVTLHSGSHSCIIYNTAAVHGTAPFFLDFGAKCGETWSISTGVDLNVIVIKEG